MAEQNKFGPMPGATPGGGGLRCEEWEALLTDALDGLLPAGDAAAFRAHSGSCANCGDLLEHAQQGRDWLGYLHTEPDVPVELLGKILERTTGAHGIPLPLVATGQTTGPVAMVMPWRRSFHETRLLMTVAMAFFSIALTLNLAGVKLTSLRIADLRPSVLGSTLSRQFYSARGQVVRYYDNLRFVYQLESRMRELRRDVETQPAPQAPRTQQPSKQNGGGNKDGHKDGRLSAEPSRGAILNAQQRSGSRLFGGAPAGGALRVSSLGRQNRCGLPQEQTPAVRARIAATITQATEVKSLGLRISISLDHHRAGLHRAANRAANERRSLV